MRPTVFLFGQAEKGEFGVPLMCRSLPEVCQLLGNPPEESQGIFYAVQTVLFSKQLLFCRVEEEGYSINDYIKGFKFLKSINQPSFLQAVIIPGVGDEQIVGAAADVCDLYKSLLVLTEKDLYDYLMNARSIAS